MTSQLLHKSFLKDLRVLVVEDTPDLLRLYEHILRRCGADVTTADNLVSAVRRFESSRPDVLVSDIAMPGGDGFDLIRRIRDIESGIEHVPAAALTALCDEDSRQHALDLGFDLYVVKPVTPLGLVSIVEDLACRGWLEARGRASSSGEESARH